ncbi:MAG: hypothetical protein R3293_06450 [Candidatus Promineifilaceae bacterium]|nr:hypothetical protein [Candidatus Promineifilaceae bacterium]
MPAHQAPAGTKRLSRLLHSPRRHWKLIERYFWKRADARLVEIEAQSEPALVVWDESILQKE